MRARAGALLLLLLGELLAGIAVRNEALAARARAEIHLRRMLRCEQDRRDLEAMEAALTAPEAVRWRLEQRKARSGIRKTEL